MKKYNRFMVASVLIYLVLAFFLWNALFSMGSEHDQLYRVECGRVMDKLKEGHRLQEIDMKLYPNISEVSYLRISDATEATMQDFFLEDKGERMAQVLPDYSNGKLRGYVKFSYYAKDLNRGSMVVQLELILFIIELILLSFLFYIKAKIVRPFLMLTELPNQIAAGHFNSEIKVEKSKYLNDFLWGMSQLQDKLDVSKRRQMELEKEKKQMLLSLSHDIKTPLNLIKLYGKFLEDDIYTEEVTRQNALHQIGIKANDIEQYVNEIIKASREDILDLQVESGEFYLKDLMDKVLDTYREQCELRRINLVVGEFDNRLLRGDIEKSREVFDNLFGNAFKYGDGVSIEISFMEEDGCQLIEFYNSGDVLNDQELNHIFDSFFRGSNSKGKSGSGLGLYICRELMAKMDGAIFTSRHNDGMEFTVVFR